LEDDVIGLGSGVGLVVLAFIGWIAITFIRRKVKKNVLTTEI